jgi:GntR family transcriptional regulator, transcriptional repressor for pyruvate dehydrogenase complex
MTSTEKVIAKSSFSSSPEDGISPTAKLLKFINEKGFAAGDRLPSERELCQIFATNRASLREILVKLETLRIIEMRPKSGIYLRQDPGERSAEALVLFAENDTPLTEGDVQQAVEVRRIVELQGVKLACERRSDADLKRLWDVLSRSQNELFDGGTLETLDTEFHLAILACTQNQMLMQIANLYYMISRDRRRIYFKDREQNERSHGQHIELFHAIKARETATAVQLLDAHVVGVGTYFDSLFKQSKNEKST